MGVGESATVPSIGAMLARWSPAGRVFARLRIRLEWGLCRIGTAFPLASLVLRYWGWRAIFYVFAGLGAIWLFFWWRDASNLPEDCPSMDAKEREYIVSLRPRLEMRPKIPWKLILGAPAAWAIFLLHFSSNWFTYFLTSWFANLSPTGSALFNQKYGRRIGSPFPLRALGLKRVGISHRST